MPRLPTVIAMVAGLFAGCASADKDGPDADPNAPDAEGSRVDAEAGHVDADPDQPDAAPHADGHLLLSEIVVTPTLGEYIEIYNPTAAAIELDDYYLADNGSYFQLPAGAPALDSSDFIVKFPSGASIAPGAAITVALAAAADFTATYPGVAPTFSMITGPTTMISVVSTANSTLTNAGEVIALFSWDGASDLVKDVDLLVAGAPSMINQFINKSSVAQDGPDAGAATSTYANDANGLPTTTPPATGAALQRIALEPGHENQSGTGNGITGDDETSEQAATTWDGGTGAPTPNATAL